MWLVTPVFTYYFIFERLWWNRSLLFTITRELFDVRWIVMRRNRNEIKHLDQWLHSYGVATLVFLNLDEHKVLLCVAANNLWGMSDACCEWNFAYLTLLFSKSKCELRDILTVTKMFLLLLFLCCGVVSIIIICIW